MTERVLSTRELNRALLARQLLLRRSPLPLTRAIEQVGCLQTQYAPSGYIALWSRLRDFRRDALTRALEKRQVVQGWIMRSTIHMASARDYWPLIEGVRRARQEAWLKAFRRQVERIDMNAVVRLVRSALREGAKRQAELAAMVKEAGYPAPGTWYGAQLWVDMVRVPPSGTWERPRADLYGLAEDWVARDGKPTEAQGMEHLVRRYLGGFGPASPKDIAGWTGLPLATIRSVLPRIKLRRFRDEDGGELLDLPRAPLPDPDTPAPVRFLPTWDATLLAHARRTQILPERFRARVFDMKTPHSVPTFLVDGAVAGTWRYEKGRVRITPFGRLSRGARKDVDAEAERLTEFHA